MNDDLQKRDCVLSEEHGDPRDLVAYCPYCGREANDPDNSGFGVFECENSGKRFTLE